MNNKHNNLKFNILSASLNQFIITNTRPLFSKKEVEPLDLTYFFDVNNPPSSKSIKFPMFLGWLIAMKRKNVYYDTDLINITGNTNIEKFYELLCFMDNKIISDQMKIIIKYDIRFGNDTPFDTRRH